MGLEKNPLSLGDLHPWKLCEKRWLDFFTFKIWDHGKMMNNFWWALWMLAKPLRVFLFTCSTYYPSWPWCIYSYHLAHIVNYHWVNPWHTIDTRILSDWWYDLVIVWEGPKALWARKVCLWMPETILHQRGYQLMTSVFAVGGSKPKSNGNLPVCMGSMAHIEGQAFLVTKRKWRT